MHYLSNLLQSYAKMQKVATYTAIFFQFEHCMSLMTAGYMERSLFTTELCHTIKRQYVTYVHGEINDLNIM